MHNIKLSILQTKSYAILVWSSPPPHYFLPWFFIQNLLELMDRKRCHQETVRNSSSIGQSNGDYVVHHLYLQELSALLFYVVLQGRKWAVRPLRMRETSAIRICSFNWQTHQNKNVCPIKIVNSTTLWHLTLQVSKKGKKSVVYVRRGRMPPPPEPRIRRVVRHKG